MASNGQLRGALLEEAVAWLLESIGYRILGAGDVGCRFASPVADCPTHL
jgi:hypothetical protein